MYLHDDPATLIVSLVDNVGADRIEVDMIQFSGPAFAQVDNRLMALQLVQERADQCGPFHRRRHGDPAGRRLLQKVHPGRARQLPSRDQGDAGHAEVRPGAFSCRNPTCRAKKS